MSRISDAKLATWMLENRIRGYTLQDYLRRSATRCAALMAIFGSVAIVCAWLETIVDFYFPLTGIVISIACGALIRDFAWFRTLRQQWPFREKTTDWNEVQRIAAGAPLH